MERQKGISTTLSVLLALLLLTIVGGIVVYRYVSITIEEPSIGELIEIQDKMIDWGTYENQEYGIEIKYPGDWHKRIYTKEDGSGEGSDLSWVNFCTHLDSKNECSCTMLLNSYGGIKEECAIITGYFIKHKSTKLEGSLVDRISDSPIEDRPQEGWEWIEVGETRAIKAHSIRYLDIIYFIPTEDGYIYQINLETSCPKETKEKCENKYELILDQMLSTFRFTGNSQEGMTDWETYENQEYGIQIRYPEDWTAIESISPGYPYLVSVSFGPKETIQQGESFAVAVRTQTEEEYLSSSQKEFIIASSTKTTMGDRPATIYNFYRSGDQESIWKTVISPLDNLLFEFSKGATPDYDEIFDQMLSTLKIIQPE